MREPNGARDKRLGKMPDGLSGRPRRRTAAQVMREETHCHLCHGPVDFTLPARHPMSASVDELVPRSLGGSSTDRRNCALAHFGCNASRGAGPPKPTQPRDPAPTSQDKRSRDW